MAEHWGPICSQSPQRVWYEIIRLNHALRRATKNRGSGPATSPRTLARRRSLRGLGRLRSATATTSLNSLTACTRLTGSAFLLAPEDSSLAELG